MAGKYETLAFKKDGQLGRLELESQDFEKAMTAYRQDRPPNWN